MKIEFIKQVQVNEGISDYRLSLVILRNGVKTIKMKVDNENEIDRIVELFKDVQNENYEIICREELL